MLSSLITLFLVSGCVSLQIPPPTVDYQTFTDSVFPCISVGYQHQVELKNIKIENKFDLDAIIYELDYGTKKSSIYKFIAINVSWNDLPINRQYKEGAKLYEIRSHGLAKKAGVVALEYVGNKKYVVGNIAFIFNKTLAINIEIKNLISELPRFDANKWKESITGKLTIKDYVNELEQLYKNTHIVDCQNPASIKPVDWERR